ncbi:MAG: integrase core domain-containing protein [Spirochaetia bacterium]
MVSIIKGETSIQEAARAHGLPVADLEDWKERFFLGADNALRARPKDDEALREEQAKKLKQNIGDLGLIFQSRQFRAACRDYRLTQEFITPYTPEQNGIIERFFRSLKDECVWQHSFHSFAEAKAAIRQWIEWYNVGRPHQSLGYKIPREYRTQLQQSVA